jgi:hypothetical protein
VDGGGQAVGSVQGRGVGSVMQEAFGRVVRVDVEGGGRE